MKTHSLKKVSAGKYRLTFSDKFLDRLLKAHSLTIPIFLSKFMAETSRLGKPCFLDLNQQYLLEKSVGLRAPDELSDYNTVLCLKFRVPDELPDYHTFLCLKWFTDGVRINDCGFEEALTAIDTGVRLIISPRDRS